MREGYAVLGYEAAMTGLIPQKSKLIRHGQTSLWIAPVIGAILAALVAAGALFLDHRVEWDDLPVPVFVGSADTARTALSVIASSVTTLLALIFTIIAVIIQLATGHYSPRALSTLLQDRPSHFTIGVFVATFTYALIVLVNLRFTVQDDGATVGGLAMTLAFGLAVLSIGTFAVYANHIVHAVRVSSIINRIAKLTRNTLDRMYPEAADDADPDGPDSPDLPAEARFLESTGAGVLVDVHTDALVELATKTDCVLRVTVPRGSFVPAGFPLVEVHAEDGAAGPEAEAVMQHIELEAERSLDRDVGFGLRQLTDIAVRALSPSINDPATAVRVIDQLHDLLRRLVVRDLAAGSRLSQDGRLRLILQPPAWKDVEHCVDEIRTYGKASLPALRRLRAMLEDVRSVAPTARAASLAEQLERLDRAADDAFDDPTTRDLAREPDLRGSGF
jgi:uncharacterized membrane protein